MEILQSINKFLSEVLGRGIKPHYSTEDMSSVLSMAAVLRTTVNAVANSPDPDTVFLRLKNGLDLERLASIIRDTAPKVKGKVTIAIDGHDVMFYGDKDTEGVVGTKEKAGSNYAFKYSAVKLICGGEAYFIDLLPMHDGSVVDAAILSLETLRKKYDIGLVLVDGEFFSTRLLDYLSRRRIHYICRRRSTKKLLECIPYKKSILVRTKEKLRPDRPDTVEVRYRLYRYHGRNGSDFFLASDLKTGSEKLRRTFKKRWGIETGFRDVNRLKIKTMSRDWRIRLLFYALSMWLYNRWLSSRTAVMPRLDSFIALILREMKKALSRLRVVFRQPFYGGAI